MLVGELTRTNPLVGVWEVKESLIEEPQSPADFDANWNILLSGTDAGKGTRLETPGQE